MRKLFKSYIKLFYIHKYGISAIIIFILYIISTYLIQSSVDYMRLLYLGGLNLSFTIILFSTIFKIHRDFKWGNKEFYYSLPYQREELFLIESASTLAVVGIYFGIMFYIQTILFSGNIVINELTIISLVFTVESIVILSDMEFKDTIKIILLVSILSLIDTIIFLLYPETHESLDAILSLLPHRLFLDLIFPLNIIYRNFKYNVYISILYIFLLFYLGIYRKERLDIF